LYAASRTSRISSFLVRWRVSKPGRPEAVLAGAPRLLGARLIGDALRRGQGNPGRLPQRWDAPRGTRRRRFRLNPLFVRARVQTWNAGIGCSTQGGAGGSQSLVRQGSGSDHIAGVQHNIAPPATVSIPCSSGLGFRPVWVLHAELPWRVSIPCSSGLGFRHGC